MKGSFEKKPQMNADERRFIDLVNQVYSCIEFLHKKILNLRFGTRMTRIIRIFADPCVSASTVTPVDCVHTYASSLAYVDVNSAQSVFYRCRINYISAFICVHLRLIFEMPKNAVYDTKGCDIL